jgi:hypothetical protein
VRTDPLVIVTQMAGMVDEQSAQLGGRLWAVSDVLRPKRAVVENSRLYTEYDGVSWGTSRYALDRFCRLQTDDEIARFALRYGRLRLCAHGLPDTHIGGSIWMGPHLPNMQTCCNASDGDGEPVATWLGYASQARAILKVAAVLHEGKLGSNDDWRQIHMGQDRRVMPPGGAPPSDIPPGDLAEQRQYLTGAVNWWLKLGGIQPELQWAPPSPAPAVRLVGGGTFGVLAAQLMFAVNRSHGWAVCDGCGEPYDRGERPRRHGRNFCAKCNDAGIPAMLRKRDERARKHAADANLDTNPSGNGGAA